jgi:hypothetical protein
LYTSNLFRVGSFVEKIFSFVILLDIGKGGLLMLSGDKTLDPKSGDGGKLEDINILLNYFLLIWR